MTTLRRKWFASALVLAVGLVLAGWWYGWFAGEPVYHGRTVTGWLDHMAIFDSLRRRDETHQNGFRFRLSPQVVTNDPALRAILAIGSQAVPTLVKRVRQPPLIKPPIQSRLESWASWAWRQLRTWKRFPHPAYRLRQSSYFEARADAAALALIALGTNAGGGMPRLMAAYATRPHYYPWIGPLAAVSCLPQRHAEMIAGITAGLAATNTAFQWWAIELTRLFPHWQRWRGKLFQLTGSPDAKVQSAALWALATEKPTDPAVLGLLVATLKNRSNPPHVRYVAEGGLELAGSKAVDALPLLRQVLAETNRDLQSGARRAIRSIKKAAKK
jgi:HEAT repeats